MYRCIPDTSMERDELHVHLLLCHLESHFFLFDNSHSNRCEVLAIVVLTCSSLMISDAEHFLCTCWPSVCLLWKNVYLDPLPVLKSYYLGLSAIECMSYLYILDIKLL